MYSLLYVARKGRWRSVIAANMRQINIRGGNLWLDSRHNLALRQPLHISSMLQRFSEAPEPEGCISAATRSSPQRSPSILGPKNGGHCLVCEAENDVQVML